MASVRRSLLKTRSNNLEICIEGSKRRGVLCNRFEDLESEIISDIISRLPIVWILSCKCVCKTWHALITDDNFVKLQLRRTNDLPSSHVILESCLDAFQFKSGKINKFLVDIEDHSSSKARVIPRVPLPDTVKTESLKIMCSLNGWICLGPEFCNTGPVVVCNPIISGDFVILPKSELKITFYESHHITLGFDHLINKYKAVRVLIYYPTRFDRRCFFEVITIGEETSWRRLVNEDNDLHFRVPRGGVFHQDSIYWIVDRCTIFPRRSDNPNRDYILEFDVSKEIFRVISFPDNIRRPTFRQASEAIENMRLQIMGGTVAVMENDDQDERLLHIWQIVRGGNWNDRVVEYSSIRISLPSKILRARVIALLHSKSDLDDFLLLERPPGQWMRPEKRVKHKKRRETEFLYYFPHSSSSKKSDQFKTLSGLQIQSYENFISWCFKPSLVSVKKNLLGHKLY